MIYYIQDNSGVESSILTACLTLIGGVILFAMSELLRVIIIKPLQKYKEEVQSTISNLDFYSNRLTNHFPDEPSKDELEIIKQIRQEVRKSATQLNTKYHAISFRKIFIYIGMIPSTEDIEKAYGDLMSLHNSILFKSQVDEYNNTSINREHIDEIKKMLKA